MDNTFYFNIYTDIWDIQYTTQEPFKNIADE